MLTSARDGPQTPEVATRAQSVGQKSLLLSSGATPEARGPWGALAASKRRDRKEPLFVNKNWTPGRNGWAQVPREASRSL